MNLVLLGLNHKTAAVALREKLAGLVTDVAGAYADLKSRPELQELVLYSTCNRVEVLCATEAPEGALRRLRDFFSHLPDASPEELKKSLYAHRDRDAVQHLFRVAASLDSLVVGEPQILGQIKEAYRQATDHRATGPILNRLLHKTFSVAKRVRRETGIGDYAVNISYAAVTLGRKIFGALAGKTAVLVGAGEMAELAVEHLRGDGVGRIIIANRTLERGLELAQRFGGEAVSLEELAEQLLFADIIISSTGSPQYLLTRDQVKGVMRRRKHKPLFFIDIAVPRDLDPAINDLDNVYLYNIDDLKEVVEINWQRRQQEAVKAERVVAEETLKFLDWLETLAVYPTIISLKEKADRICEAELDKTLKHLGPLTDEQRQALEVLTHSIASKLIHDPILFLKGDQHPERPTQSLDLVRRLFNLDPDREGERVEEE
ncbi:MAG: glutamyl-tRNA reductase [Deltaproteobacteria bacterium]|nr:MAG: glutamyl-tRNA reductase [Deltaproteobacteria bacterium]